MSFREVLGRRQWNLLKSKTLRSRGFGLRAKRLIWRDRILLRQSIADGERNNLSRMKSHCSSTVGAVWSRTQQNHIVKRKFPVKRIVDRNSLPRNCVEKIGYYYSRDDCLVASSKYQKT